MKTCACCGKSYANKPQGGMEDELGYFWNCSCNSTLFWPSQMALDMIAPKTDISDLSDNTLELETLQGDALEDLG